MSTLKPGSTEAFAPDLQDRRLPRDEHESLAVGTQAAFSYRGGNFASWKAHARQRLVAQLGLDPQEEDRSFEVALLWDRPHRLGRIQKLLLRAAGLADMPMYWCLPNEGAGPLPVMICL